MIQNHFLIGITSTGLRYRTNTSHLSIRDWKTEQLFCFEDCKLTVPELRDEIQGLKDEKYYLQASYDSNETVSKLWEFQAQKGFLHAQLENSLTMNNKLESEVTGLKYELRNKESENQELRNRVLRLEVWTQFSISLTDLYDLSQKEVTLKPEIPPPPPPPPPPKSLFTQLRRNIIRKSKRAASVPNINTLCAAGTEKQGFGKYFTFLHTLTPLYWSITVQILFKWLITDYWTIRPSMQSRTLFSITRIFLCSSRSETQQWNTGGDKEQILPAPSCEEERPRHQEKFERGREWREAEHRPDTRQEDLHGIQQLRRWQHQHQELQQHQVIIC